jgi:hypothetical protein
LTEQQHDPTYDEIAQRAYEISESDEAGSEEENWRRAEAELRGKGQEDGQGEGPWAKIGSGDTESVTES